MKKKFLVLIGVLSGIGAYYCVKRKEKYDLAKGYGILGLWTAPKWIMNDHVIEIGNSMLKKMKSFREESEQDIPVNDDEIDGVPVTIYGNMQEKAPILLYFHGGAFAYGAAPYFDQMMRLYSKISGCTIVFVHYRTEAYPAPLADGIRVLKHIYETTTKDIPIGVAGDSAGGCIAAALSLWARDNGSELQAQMLIYPVLDLNMDSNSMKEFTDSPIWNSKVNEVMWQRYTEGCGFEFPQYLSPMLETNFENLPPTMIEAEQYDCLRDEAIAYGQKLFDAGVNVHTYLNKGLFHGFELCFNDQTKSIIERRALRLKEMMSPKIQEEMIVIEEIEKKEKDGE